jgi:membrane protein implicated in regulation of membrane protease activity
MLAGRDGSLASIAVRPATLSHPFVIMLGMQSATTLQFATAARVLGREARVRGLEVPGFRSPPRLEGADRTLRRRVQGGTVAVRIRGRPWAAVLSDMIEGVVVVNGLAGIDADALRGALWEAVGDALASSTVEVPARVA